VSRAKPFGSGLFMWIDAGFCARALQLPLRLNFFRVRQERLLVFVIRYHFAGGQDMHGFTEEGYRTLSGSQPWMHARGNIFSGNAAAIEAGTSAYELSLNDSLARGFMGTEESALTLAIMRSPNLFHVIVPLFLHLAHYVCSAFLNCHDLPQTPVISSAYGHAELPCRMFRMLSHHRDDVAPWLDECRHGLQLRRAACF
jgi:hypothetical protein